MPECNLRTEIWSITDLTDFFFFANSSPVIGKKVEVSDRQKDNTDQLT